MGFGGFSWKRALGITRAKQRISRSIGIPLTKSGRQRKLGKAMSGCYIATAIYGSYYCSEVIILRKYRDNILEKTILGRLFISIYYALSPIVVRCFGKCKIFPVIFRPILEMILDKLKNDKRI